MPDPARTSKATVLDKDPNLLKVRIIVPNLEANARQACRAGSSASRAIARRKDRYARRCLEMVSAHCRCIRRRIKVFARSGAARNLSNVFANDVGRTHPDENLKGHVNHQ